MGGSGTAVARRTSPQFLYNAACTFAQLGEDSRALDLLERAVDLGYGDRVWIEHDSDFASLHGTPRFDMLLQRMPGAPG